MINDSETVAAEVARLRAENKGLREAGEALVEAYNAGDTACMLTTLIENLEAALEGEEGK